MAAIIKRLNEIEERKLQIRKLLESNETADLDALDKELRDLDAEKAQIERRQKIVEGINAGMIPASSIPNPAAQTRSSEPTTENILETPEYRSAFFKNLMGKPLNDAEKRAFAASGATGATPVSTANKIISKIKQLAPMLDEITLFHFPGAVKFAVEGTRNAATKHTENASIDDSEDTLVTITLGAYEIVKILMVSETVKQTTVDGMEDWIIENLNVSCAEKIDAFIAGGSGSSEPKGVAYAATWVANTNARQWAGAALADADLTAGIALLPGRYDKGAKFYMSKNTFWNNVAPIRDDSKAPIVKELNGVFYVHGYEVKMDDNYADGVIFFGNAKYIYGNLGENINVKADVSAGFKTASIVYRGMAIFDCQPAVADAFVKIAASI